MNLAQPGNRTPTLSTVGCTGEEGNTVVTSSVVAGEARIKTAMSL